jgi:hypothetical protein
VFIKDILANMTQVSNVAPGPLVDFLNKFFYAFLRIRVKIHHPNFPFAYLFPLSMEDDSFNKFESPLPHNHDMCHASLSFKSCYNFLSPFCIGYDTSFEHTWIFSFFFLIPVRIHVRIDPPHPLVCCKRRLNGAVLRMRPEKLRSRVAAGVAW